MTPNEYMDMSAGAMSYSSALLSQSEQAAYLAFVEAAVELVDEERMPECVQRLTRDNAIKHIRHILTLNIRAYRLRRMFPVLAPETALDFANDVARSGYDKRFWK